MTDMEKRSIPAFSMGSPNVQDILTNFEFRNQIPRLSKADALGRLIEKFLNKDINLGPQPASDLPGLDNHSMGTMFEELVRRFNEESNEEASEHWTPRDAVRLMANLMFLPVSHRIESGTYLLYDCTCDEWTAENDARWQFCSRKSESTLTLAA